MTLYEECFIPKFKATPRLTMPSNGGLMNPAFKYHRLRNPILEDFKLQREIERELLRRQIDSLNTPRELLNLKMEEKKDD